MARGPHPTNFLHFVPLSLDTHQHTKAHSCTHMRITIIVTEPEHAELKRRAGLVPLSRWVKNTVLSDDALPLHEWKQLPKREGLSSFANGAPDWRGAAGFSGQPEPPKISETPVEVERREVRRGNSVVDKIADVTHEVIRRGTRLPSGEIPTMPVGELEQTEAENPLKLERAKYPGKLKRGKAEKTGKCTAPVGPGIFCSSCGKRH